MKIVDPPEVYLSHSIICNSKRVEGCKNHFKQAIIGLIRAGHVVAAYENSIDKPTVVFRDVASFDYWYENFARIQGWILPDAPQTERDTSDYFNCSTIE